MIAEVSLTAAPLKEKRRSISPSSRTSTAKKSGRSDDDRPIRKMQKRTNTKNSSWTLAMARVENVWAERVRHDWPVECARHSTILQTGKQQSREGRRYASFPGSSRGLVDLASNGSCPIPWRQIGPCALARTNTFTPCGENVKNFNNRAELLMF